MKLQLLCVFLLAVPVVYGQLHKSLKNINPEADYENVAVTLITQDSLQSSFLIWIKKDVRGHFHQYHTENIVVLEGKAEMRFNGEKIIIKKGDYLNIPKGTHHSVERVLSRKPLKVLSIQSPYFDGKDRIFILESQTKN
jgi:mannose-6-phosphate isomerase-like protein (cupin superfamily)